MPVFLSPVTDVLRIAALLLAFCVGLLPLRLVADCSVVAEDALGALQQLASARFTYAFEGVLLLEQAKQRQFLTAASYPGDSVSVQKMNSGTPGDIAEFPLLRDASAINPCDVATTYQLALERGSTVAGRPTRRLLVRPKDTLRFGYIMDLDADTGLPLRVVTTSADGQMIERYEFATIKVDKVLAGNRETTAVPTDAQGPALGRLPPGFSEALRTGEQIVVSDGLASASVFIEASSGVPSAGEGAVRHGSTVTYTRGIQTGDGDWIVTVIGEVPLTTARLLANAVALGGEG